ncbi:thiol reductant ABC exporter subunit CydC [Mycobacterium intracellulare]|uniref:thiol reductant ABC exporter subunit CydC n=2 Tax=Mycobacterium intracellulare TaxID=1767 RepID=UPI0004504917|nr:thiol reductant ABC exporter subunit CydC [Mycobacterium intracellulare]AOS92553.1 thiol reductant ABC exporter subunit CydC [Mycobacterium intracellulare subsp. chimaera]ARV82842.1 thiol reductant ABC exporter subunit CydC [Mycobacterium intracellulare subsp. chimaera]ASL10030.1 ABC transporter ATP-binding protein CydC [Mycobacterium intracellulare subsp. chimaera]ASL21931.1 ABC transporter ATP-binding protein CydC [Mycobacterium intracellulare subsp. chimaera]ETZ29453.1 thiol reductant AB
MPRPDSAATRPEPLFAAAALLRPRLPRVLAAITLGVLSLGSALALAGVAAWLITRAWQMPPVLDLSVAAVAVRLFAISRAVLHYCERLVTHDTALRAAGTARVQVYQRLARGPAAAAVRLHSGELVSRVGADVDELANVLVRALVPIGVAAVLALAATAVVAAISPAAAVVLAICLLIAGFVAPRLAARAAATQEEIARQQHSERDTSALVALEHAPELRVAGLLPGVIAESRRRHRAWGDALDTAAKPAAIAEAMTTAAVGASVLGAVVAGIGLAPAVAPTTLAVLMLLPLSAFEAMTPLPAAAVQLTRSRIAARRLLELAAEGPRETVDATQTTPRPVGTCRLSADVRSGHSAAGSIRVALDLPPGARLAVTGASGSGKTTLLMTLAGLLPPREGQVLLDGVAATRFDEADLRCAIGFFAEDAHIFATTIRDNLLVARGDRRDDELTAALGAVGLGGWLAGLPEGLATVLISGAQSLSAGQRRRLLLARAVLSPARIVLLDEPTEHLDVTDAEKVLRDLLAPDSRMLSPERTVVVATHHLPKEIGCDELRVDHKA